MIKKFLLTILVIILAIGLFSSFAHGVNIKFLNVSTKSYSGIAKSSEELVKKRQELEKINNVEFPNEIQKQKAAISGFKEKKSNYENTALEASPSEIRQANQKEVYYLDFLWMKIGTYANDSDIKVSIVPEENNSINFNVSGQYIAVINFIYDLQNDDDLTFNIDNIVMQGGSTSAITNAKFYVSNIEIVS